MQWCGQLPAESNCNRAPSMGPSGKPALGRSFFPVLLGNSGSSKTKNKICRQKDQFHGKAFGVDGAKSLMLEQDQIARWIVGLAPQEQGSEQAQGFIRASQQVWPRVLAHARRELSDKHLSGTEITSFVLEIWEQVLRSVWKTLQRANTAADIKNLENYLIGTFHHRLNRNLKHRRIQDNLLAFLPPEELSEFPSRDQRGDWATQTERTVQLNQVYAMMDDNIRRAVIAKVYGFSWAEIAKTFRIDEQNLIMRVQYAFRKIRAKLDRHRKPGLRKVNKNKLK
jgi:DNA-directed RNA polymerase specialized sigma24 family protein